MCYRLPLNVPEVPETSDMGCFLSTPVANVGFETTEAQLGQVLCEVGPIVNLK